MSLELKQVFETSDGRTFDTRAEALNYLRRPKIEEALKKITSGNKDLAQWLLDNQETVEMAFETGTIRRVTKSEHKKLVKALEALKEYANDTKLGFIVENSDAIAASFRWPSVKRMTDEEKVAEARKTLVDESGREDLADWVMANKDEVLAAYEAGIEKRQINSKAVEALAAYREKMAKQKAAKGGTATAAKK
jgi:hypothetical protein